MWRPFAYFVINVNNGGEREFRGYNVSIVNDSSPVQHAVSFNICGDGYLGGLAQFRWLQSGRAKQNRDVWSLDEVRLVAHYGDYGVECVAVPVLSEDFENGSSLK